MTTNPIGYAGYRIPTGFEWRTDPVLDRYHEINLKLAFTPCLRILDTYHIAIPLNDIMYDESHYQGTVGWMLATYVLEEICGGKD
jgi:hypothetical protein